jgi:hypothetical protein
MGEENIKEVETVLVTTASEELKAQVIEEMKIPDPEDKDALAKLI